MEYFNVSELIYSLQANLDSLKKASNKDEFVSALEDMNINIRDLYFEVEKDET